MSQERLKILNAHLRISRPSSSLSEYTRYSLTPEPGASRNQASTFRNQRNTSTPEASTSGNHLDYEEDYFASCSLITRQRISVGLRHDFSGDALHRRDSVAGHR